MSNFTAPTFHPKTGKIEQANWVDNHFGHYGYGVRFPDGEIFRAHRCERVFPQAMAEIERLRGVIDSGTDAIRGVIVRGGGDLERIDAIQRHMRREMFRNLGTITS